MAPRTAREGNVNTKSRTTKAANTPEPSAQDVEQVIAEAERTLANTTDAAKPKATTSRRTSSAQRGQRPKPARSKKREATVTAAGVAGGETARRAIASAVDREQVIAV